MLRAEIWFFIFCRLGDRFLVCLPRDRLILIEIFLDDGTYSASIITAALRDSNQAIFFSKKQMLEKIRANFFLEKADA
jgi:hypothetical protein